MQTLSITADHLSENVQFPYYREQLFERRIGITVERGGEWSIDPSLMLFRAQCQGYLAVRAPADIGRIDWQDWIAVFLEKGEGACFSQGAGTLVTRAGDMVLLDPATPFSQTNVSARRHDVWFLPRTAFQAHFASRGAPAFLLLERDQAMVRLLQAYMAGLEQEMDALDGAQRSAVAAHLCRLLALACGGAQDGEATAARAGLLAAAQQHVERHLRDAKLSPGGVAAALKISSRQLHRLFEPTGESFEGYVMRRRLEECRDAMLDPLGAPRSTTDVALYWGFNSLPTFYRNFSRQFGAAPGSLRRARMARLETPPGAG